MSIKTEWREIPHFPDYAVDELGQVYNSRRQIMMRTTPTLQGHEKVSLIGSDGRRHTLSMSVVVAEAFIHRPNELCDTVVALDGDRRNVAASNLAWRPRWFAWKYARQLKVPQPLHFRNLHVTNLMHNVEYENIVQAGMYEGLLFEDIWKSTYELTRVFPYGSVWEISERG